MWPSGVTSKMWTLRNGLVTATVEQTQTHVMMLMIITVVVVVAVGMVSLVREVTL